MAQGIHNAETARLTRERKKNHEEQMKKAFGAHNVPLGRPVTETEMIMKVSPFYQPPRKAKTLRKSKADPRIGIVTTPQGRKFKVSTVCEHWLNKDDECRFKCDTWKEAHEEEAQSA